MSRSEEWHTANQDGVMPSGDYLRNSNLNGSCVEVAVSTRGDTVKIRDTKDKERRAVVVRATDWAVFLGWVKRGDLDTDRVVARESIPSLYGTENSGVSVTAQNSGDPDGQVTIQLGSYIGFEETTHMPDAHQYLPREWDALLRGVKEGKFDHTAGVAVGVMNRIVAGEELGRQACAEVLTAT